MTLYDELFQNAFKIELRIAALYKAYAENPTVEDEEVRQFFAQMAVEEERHAQILNSLGPDTKIKDPSKSPLPILRAQRDLLDLLDEYDEEATGELTAQTVLRHAFRLENSLPERLLGRIRKLVTGSAVGALQTLSDESAEHSLRVRRFAREKNIRFSSIGATPGNKPA